jgi:hypothetical protein
MRPISASTTATATGSGRRVVRRGRPRVCGQHMRRQNSLIPTSSAPNRVKLP